MIKAGSRVFDTSSMPRRKLAALKTGYDCVNAPSIAARRFWYYVLNMGEAHWPPGFEFGHPRPNIDNQGFLLHFVLEGELIHQLGRRRFVARRNDAVLLDLARPETHRNDTRMPVRFLWILFDGWGLPQIFGALRAGTDPVVHELRRKVIMGIFRDLLDVIAAETAWYEARMSALLGNMLAELFTARPPSPDAMGVLAAPASASDCVRSVLEYVARGYHRRLSLKELSAEAGLNLYHFSHRFRQETGFSPMAYVNRYRVEQAKTLLSATDMPVGRVAEAVGIPNARYFGRLFRKLSGFVPRAYRTRNQPGKRQSAA